MTRHLTAAFASVVFLEKGEGAGCDPAILRLYCQGHSARVLPKVFRHAFRLKNA